MEKNAHYPFSYHAGMKILRSVPKKKIITNLKRLFSEHQLEEADTIILNMLSKYGYLNAFLLRVLLEQNHVSCNQNFVTKHLAFLETQGLISRFQFYYNDEEEKQHFTPFIYEATYKTKKLFLQHIDIKAEESLETILRQLSYNQFHILFTKQMAGALTFSSIHFNGNSDGTYRFYSQGKTVTFYVLSQRLTDEWKTAYIERLKKLKLHMQHNNLTCSGIIVICENEMHSLQAEKQRKSTVECKNLPVYYVCDYTAVKEGFILGQLIHVNPEHDYSTYDIIKVPVDGNIFISTNIIETATEESEKIFNNKA